MQYEVEMKALLKNEQATKDLLGFLKKLDTSLVLLRKEKQLNHYFQFGDILKLIGSLEDYLTTSDIKILNNIHNKATSVSVRTREKNGLTIIVVKGSMDKTDAVHSHKRMEFEKELPIDIEDLDTTLINNGFSVEAKWSATRKMYRFLDTTVDIMFTPGYGYVVEIEKLIYDESDIETARKDIKALMGKLGLETLSSARLGRMYNFYNNHWQEYYGTKKVFTID